LLVDQEWTERENRKFSRRIKEARLSTRVAPDEIICDTVRGLETRIVARPHQCQWVRSHHNIVVVGPTGVGNSILANAFAQEACRQGFRSLFVRVCRLLEQLFVARASADYNATLARIAKIDVLVLDEFLLAPLTDTERRDLLELLEDRYGKTFTGKSVGLSPR
jgi:DNA replication protein DnaC